MVDAARSTSTSPGPTARAGQCTARSKQTGARCRRWAMVGKVVCMMHGGKSLAGAASPSFKDGRHSKYLPDRLASRYQEARHDGELLGLHDDIALADARVGDLLARVDVGESGALWQATRQMFQAMARETDPARRMETERQLGALIEQGIGDFAVWADIARWLEQGRRLRETERKRLEALEQTMTAEQAVTLLAAVAGAVQRHVEDEEVRRAIGDEIRRLAHAAAGGHAGAATTGA